MQWLCLNKALLLGVVLTVFTANGLCWAGSIGVTGGTVVVDFGQISPQDSPHLIPLASQFLITAPAEPWYLSVCSDSHFRTSEGEAVLPAERLQWAVHSDQKPNQWNPFGTNAQVVASGSVPTEPGGHRVALDYRLLVGWDVPATREPVTLSVEYTAGATADIYSSYASPNPFRLDQGEAVAIGFYLLQTGPQTVTLTVSTLSGEPVYQRQEVLEGGGWQSLSWTGVRDGGGYVGSGQYNYEVVVEGEVVAAGTIVAEFAMSGTARIDGRLTDAETGEPLSGGVVKLYNSNYRLCQTVETDGSGHFQLAWLASGAYFLSASCPSYYPQETGWIALGPGQVEEVNIQLVHNRSLAVEYFRVPEIWPVGQLAEITFRVTNPGTAAVLAASAKLCFPPWVKLLSDTVQLVKGGSSIWDAAGRVSMQGPSQMEVELGSLEPGQSVDVTLLAYGVPVPSDSFGRALLRVEGTTSSEKVETVPTTRPVRISSAAFDPVTPGNRLLTNSRWHTKDQLWSGGLYVNYPVETQLSLTERAYLTKYHQVDWGQNQGGTADGTGSGLKMDEPLEPVTVSVGKSHFEACAWVEREDLMAVGVGEKKVLAAPAGSEGIRAAGVHTSLSLPAGDLWLGLGSPERVSRVQRWAIDKVIREVTLQWVPDDPQSVKVFLDWGQGRRKPVDAAEYYVSLLEKQVVFFHPLIPETLKDERPTSLGEEAEGKQIPDLVVEYTSRWQPGDRVNVWETGFSSNLGRAQAQICFLQAPRESGNQSRWLSVQTDNRSKAGALTYSALVSFQAEETTGDDKANQAIWERVLSNSAASVEVEWKPNHRASVAVSGYQSGDLYHPPGGTEERRSDWEVSSRVEAAPHLSLEAEAALRQTDSTAEHDAHSLGGWIHYTPQGLPAVKLGFSQTVSRGAFTSREQSASGQVRGSTGPVVWYLDGELTRRTHGSGDVLTGGGVGFGVDCTVASWASAAVAFRRSMRQADGNETANDDGSIPSDGTSFPVSDTLDFTLKLDHLGPVSGFVTQGWSWSGEVIQQGGGDHSPQKLELTPVVRTLDFAVEGKAREKVDWQVGLSHREDLVNGGSDTTAVKARVEWGTRQQNGLSGVLEWSREFGRPGRSEMTADLLALQPSLGSRWDLTQNGFHGQITYSPAEQEGAQVKGDLKILHLRGANDDARTQSVGVELVLPWQERLDLLLSLSLQHSARREVQVLTRQGGAGVLYRLTPNWQVRCEAKRTAQSGFGALNAVSVGIGWQLLPQVSIFAGVSRAWNGKKVHEDEGLRPYIQLFWGKVPRALLLTGGR